MVHARLLKFIHQGLNQPSCDVVDFERDEARSRKREANRCGGMEGIWVVLEKTHDQRMSIPRIGL